MKLSYKMEVVPITGSVLMQLNNMNEKFCLKSSESTSLKHSCLIKVSDTKKNLRKCYQLVYTRVVGVVDVCAYTYSIYFF